MTRFAPVAGIVDAVRNGRVVVLVDDASPTSTGSLVLPAQMTTPDGINFMARHGRGLVCLALTRQRADALGLRPLASTGSERNAGFTVSIEARCGVSTGISAADRARTILAAVDAANDADALVTPSHVFPIVARDGGVLVRAAVPEAAVDVARLAGINPSAVVCSILNEDGSTARLAELFELAGAHDLVIGSVRDLIAYRRRHDHYMVRNARATFQSHWGGEWTALTFRNTLSGRETMALVKGAVGEGGPTLVRMHARNPFDDALALDSARSGLLTRAMTMIGAAGRGVVVLLNLLPTLSNVTRELESGGSPEMHELRDYGVGAQILAELGVREMILLTHTRRTLVALDGYGPAVVEERAI